MSHTEYRRTPLPANLRPYNGWLVFCFIGLILSPFVSFAIHGKVEEPGLVIGLLVAVIPLSGLLALFILSWLAWRKLPSHIVEEQKYGRVFLAENAPTAPSPARFSNQNDWIEMLPEGVNISRHALLSMQGVSESMAKTWIADQIQEFFIAWSDLIEWVVENDRDGPDYYLLKLHPKGKIMLRRFKPDTSTVCDILDAVRSVGKVPVRLRCDVELE